MDRRESPSRGSKLLLVAVLCWSAVSCGARGGGEAPAGSPEDGAGQSAELREIEAQALPDAAYRALGLTGRNKPAGPEYRLRVDVPASTPEYVPRSMADARLTIADSTRDGWLAFYKGPLRDGWRNARYAAALYGFDGQLRWRLPLNPFLSRKDHLEIADIRYEDDRLYFNEACQTYSREAGGECSSLLRIDPVAATVEWRTPPLTSNNIFILHGPWVIAGYGFTAEPDSLFLLRRDTGEIAHRRGLDTAHQYLEVVDGELVVLTNARLYRYALPAR